MAMILVTHDLGVVAGRTDEIIVMYGGKVVEQAPTPVLFSRDEDALHRGAAALDPQARAPEPHPAEGHRRSPARPHQPAEGLQLQPPLPVRAAQVPRGGAPLVEADDTRPPVPPAGSRSALAREPRRRSSATSPRRRPRPLCPPTARPSRRRLMAGSGTAHLRPAERSCCASRTSPSSSPWGARASRSTPCPTSASTSLEGRDARPRRRVGLRQVDHRRAIMQLPRPRRAGRVRGTDLTKLDGDERCAGCAARDPDDLPGPDLVAEPRRARSATSSPNRCHLGTRHQGGAEAKVDEVLEAVGIDPDVVRQPKPHEFSGGQCQRISHRPGSLVLDPKVIICDEPVSALDVSVQAQILNLLEDMKERYDLTLVFIAHDLAVVKNVSDRVAVMYLGKMCEVGPARRALRAPAHPYTRRCCHLDPGARPRRCAPRGRHLGGELPSPIAPPSGCRFRTRCPHHAPGPRSAPWPQVDEAEQRREASVAPPAPRSGAGPAHRQQGAPVVRETAGHGFSSRHADRHQRQLYGVTIATDRGHHPDGPGPGAGAPRRSTTSWSLARNGFYDGLTFHRVVPGFVIQGG
jgi:peptide/nickel transport system ATP-binding protein